MARTQGAALDRKKLMADPIMVTTIVVLIAFLTLFILYPLAILLVDSFVGDGSLSLDTFRRIFAMPRITTAITNTLKVGFLESLSAYVELPLIADGYWKMVDRNPGTSAYTNVSLCVYDGATGAAYLLAMDI